MIDLLIADCDGTILDSQFEGLVTAANVLQRTTPGRRLLTTDAVEHVYPGAQSAFEDARPHMTDVQHYLVVLGQLRPRGRPDAVHYTSREELGAAEHKYRSVLKQRARQSPQEEFHLDTLVSIMSSMRNLLAQEHPTQYAALFPAYDGMSQIMDDAQNVMPVYVSTNKTQAAEHLSIAGCGLPRGHVYTPKLSGPKEQHIRAIRARHTTIREERTLFLDDCIQHCVRAKNTFPQMQVALAGWGYNTPQQQALARQNNIQVMQTPSALRTQLTYD